MRQIKTGEGCMRVGKTVWNALKGGGIEKRGGGRNKHFKKGGKLSQGLGALKGRAGTPLWTTKIFAKFAIGSGVSRSRK